MNTDKEISSKTIIHFIHEIGNGGASALVKDYSKLLIDDGYNPIVVVTFSAPETSNYKMLEEYGIKILHLYPKRNFFWRAINRIIPHIYISRGLLKIIKREQPIALHIHLSVLQYVAPVRKRIKCNVLYTCHSLPGVMITNQNREINAAKRLLRDNDLQMIALHQEMADELNDFFDINNTRVVMNGIDLSKFEKNDALNRKLIRKEVGIGIDAFVVGHVGRFTPQKNHSFLLDVFKELTKKISNAELLLIGSGDELINICKKAKSLGVREKVHILSNRTDVPNLLRTMDLFVFPSTYEGLGIALVEAQAAGLRCVASDKIPKEAFFSKNALRLPLEDSPAVWAKIALDNQIQGDLIRDIKEYDMHLIVKELETMYCKGK